MGQQRTNFVVPNKMTSTVPTNVNGAITNVVLFQQTERGGSPVIRET